MSGASNNSGWDYGWSSGPIGGFPFHIISLTDNLSERSYFLGSNVYTGSDVFHIPGAVVQYSVAAGAAAAPIFRRTINRRTGARGAMT